MGSMNEHVNRRLHSLLGVFPIGLYLVFHLVANYFATRGPEAYNSVIEFIEGLPFLIFLEIFLIYLPLLFHSIYGIYIAFQASNNVSRYGYFRNLMFFVQRITGVITLIFISWHVWETRIQKALGEEVNFNMMADILDNPFMMIFYALGIISTVFHFSNGLWSFMVSWGITITPRSQVISTYVTGVIFITLTIIGLMSLFAFQV
ncbi:succinate dehydrogenase cytochrome b558 subunit [Cytobacillus firmus]|uniref:succinate dehydrogenase cytochrome b558 subunit n=1 Tax=Cytobacillus firmus TaxID=1399 RepID=UPI0034A27B01